MSKNSKLLLELLNLKDKYSDTITELSKTNENPATPENNNIFIESDVKMISGDAISEEQPIPYASVDAIDFKEGYNHNIILDFYEFKKFDLKDDLWSNKKNLQTYINEKIGACEKKCPYYDGLLKRTKPLLNDTLTSLKIKGLETLNLLNTLYPELRKEIFIAKKRYFVVSEIKNDYVVSPNISRRKKTTYSFLYPINPYPFEDTQCITKKTFMEIISNDD